MLDQATAKHESLAARLARERRLDVANVLALAIAAAERVAALHRQSEVHGGVSTESIYYGDDDRPTLDGPGAHWRLADTDFPPDLSALAGELLPRSFDALRARFAEAQIDYPIVGVDLFSLGGLLVRACGVRSVDEYLQSPRAYAAVPTLLKPLVDRSIATGPQAFRSLEEFLAAARLAIEPAKNSAEMIPAKTNSGQTDTTPSQILGEPKPDTVAPPTRQRGGSQVENASPDEGADAPLRTLGHYQILELIGRGGMGDVYRAYEPALDRTVALKVLPVELARDSDFVRRFRAEAAAVAGLSHPNIVHIHFIGEDAGRHFFAMQFVPGESLATTIQRRGALPIDEAVSIVEQILAGLGAAHRQRIVHRDIKPSNILIDGGDGRALIADFGLVKMLERGVEQTATGVVMGTLDYLSPEQARGKPVDGRSDLYSLGAVFFQLLSGRLPFEADSPTAMIFQHVYEPPPALCDVAPGVPRPLATIVARLLAKGADDRYATAGDVLADLRAYRDGAPLPSLVRAATHSAAIAKPSRALSGVGKTEIISAPQFPEEPSIEELEAELAASSATTATPVGWRGKLHAALQGRFGKRVVERVWGGEAPDFVKRLQTTQQQLDGAVLEYERRRNAIRDLLGEAEAVEVELERQRDDWLATAAVHEEQAPISDQTQAFIARREKERCQEQSAELGEQLEEQREAIASMRLSLAQAEARLLQLRGQRDALNARLNAAQAQIRLAAPTTAGERRAEVAAKTWRYARLAALGTVLLVAAGLLVAKLMRGARENSLANQETETGAETTSLGESTNVPAVSVQAPLMRFPGVDSEVSCIAIDPRGELVAAGAQGTVRVWNSATGAPKYAIPTGTLIVRTIAFSPDGRYFATGTRSEQGDVQTVELWRASDGVQMHPFEGQAGDVVQLAFSGEGDKLIGYDHGASAIRIWQVDSGKYLKNFPVTKDARSVAIDAQRAVAVLSSDAHLQFFDLTGEKIGSSNRLDNVTHLALSPDGSTLATADVNGKILLRSVKDLKVVRELLGVQGTVRSLAFSKSGSRMVAVSAQAIHVWSTRTDQPGRVVPSPANAAVAFTPEGRQLISAGERSPVVMWDASLAPIVVSRPEAELTIEKSHRVQLGLHGSELVISSHANTLGLWNYSKSSRLDPLPFSAGKVMSAATSPNQRYSAFGDKEGSVFVYDLETKKLAGQIDTRDRNRRSENPFVRDLAFASDNRRLLVATEFSMMIWDFASGEQKFPFQGAIAATAVATSPDGRFAAAGSHVTTEGIGDLRLWNLETGAQVRRLIGQRSRINALAFSPDSQKLLSAGKGVAYVWNVASGDIERHFSLQSVEGVIGAPLSEIEAVAFMNNGRLAATGDSRSASIWDLETGDELVRFVPPIDYAQSISSLLVTPSGLLASSGGDGRVRLWRLPSGI